MAFTDWEFTKDAFSGFWTAQHNPSSLTLFCENAGTVSTFAFPKEGGAYPRGFNMGVLRTLINLGVYGIAGGAGYWLFMGLHALTQTYPLAGMSYGLRIHANNNPPPEFALVEVRYSSGSPIFDTRHSRPLSDVFPGTSPSSWFALEYWFWTDATQLHSFVFKCNASLETNFTAMTPVFGTLVDHDLPGQTYQSQGEGFFAHLYAAFPSTASITFDQTSLHALS